MGGFGVGGGAGVKIGGGGVHPYVTSCFLASFGPGVSVTVSPTNPTSGLSTGASAFIPWDIGGSYSTDGSWEIGMGTPGVCVGSTYTW